MPTTTKLQTFFPKISGDVPWEVRQHLELIYGKLNNHAQAIVASHTTQSTATTTIEQIASGSTGGGGSTSMGMTVNDQSGAVAYTTGPGDNGTLIILDDASPIAVTLGTGVAIPWSVFFTNLGSGLATFTPQSGTINGSATFALPLNYTSIIAFDGTNFFATALPIVPATFTPVAHEFLTGYNATTGLFTAAQPAIADVSGLTAALASLAPIASPTFTGTVTQPDATVLTAATTATSATAGAGTALPATPALYLEVSINGVTYKIAAFNL